MHDALRVVAHVDPDKFHRSFHKHSIDLGVHAMGLATLLFQAYGREEVAMACRGDIPENAPDEEVYGALVLALLKIAGEHVEAGGGHFE